MHFHPIKTTGCDACFDEVCFRCASARHGVGRLSDIRPDGKPLCSVPPLGATSPSSGATVASLTLDEGYFRTSNGSHIIPQCYRESSCQGGKDADNCCEPGYTGPCEKAFSGNFPELQYPCTTGWVGLTLNERTVWALHYLVSTVCFKLKLHTHIFVLSLRPTPDNKVTSPDGTTLFMHPFGHLNNNIEARRLNTYFLFPLAAPDCAVCDQGFAPGIAYSCRKCSGDTTRLAVRLAVSVAVALLILACLLVSYLWSAVHDGTEEGMEIGQRS